MEWGQQFIHNLPIEPTRLLSMVGVNARDPRYGYLHDQANIIINNQLIVSARLLNIQLQGLFEQAMYGIYEYREFPRYMLVMKKCLSNPNHIGTYWDNNVIQLQFIDYHLIGDTQLLVEIAHYIRRAFYSGSNVGSTIGWWRFYRAWLEGKARAEYDAVMNARLDMMESWGGECIAPFLEIVDGGNVQYGVMPYHERTGVLDVMLGQFEIEMANAYNKTVEMIRALAMRQLAYGFGVYDVVTVVIDDKLVTGYEWMSQSGNRMFVQEGTFRIVAGRPYGKGFMLSSTGKVVKEFNGWMQGPFKFIRSIK